MHFLFPAKRKPCTNVPTHCPPKQFIRVQGYLYFYFAKQSLVLIHLNYFNYLLPPRPTTKHSRISWMPPHSLSNRFETDTVVLQGHNTCWPSPLMLLRWLIVHYIFPTGCFTLPGDIRTISTI